MHALLSAMDDETLLASTRRLASAASTTEADLLLHLAEVDARKLFAPLGYSSMFKYATHALGFSKYAALDRITVSRLARRLPETVGWLRDGRINLTALRLLSSVLTEANCSGVLGRAVGLTTDEVCILVAELNPQPPVPDSIRKCPSRAVASTAPVPALELPLAPPAPSVPSAPLGLATPPSSASEPPPARELPRQAAPSPQLDSAAPLAPPAAARSLAKGKVQPLAPDAYKVQFTADEELRDLLVCAQELLSHRKDSRDLASVMKQGLKLLVAKLKKERFGLGAKPRAQAPAAPAPPSMPSTTVTRHVPRGVARETVERDGLECTFVSADGLRCAERAFLQLEHLEPFAWTHEHSTAKLTVRCATHNQYAADQVFGRGFMDAKRLGTRVKTNTPEHASPVPEPAVGTV